MLIWDGHGNEIITSEQPRGIPEALLSRRQSSSATRLGQPTDHAREFSGKSCELLVASCEFCFARHSQLTTTHSPLFRKSPASTITSFFGSRYFRQALTTSSGVTFFTRASKSA